MPTVLWDMVAGLFAFIFWMSRRGRTVLCRRGTGLLFISRGLRACRVVLRRRSISWLDGTSMQCTFSPKTGSVAGTVSILDNVGILFRVRLSPPRTGLRHVVSLHPPCGRLSIFIVSRQQSRGVEFQRAQVY